VVRFSGACAVSIFIINLCHSRTELLFWIRRAALRCAGAWLVLIFIMNVCHFRTELPFWIGHGALRCSGACAVLIISFPWLLLGAPGCSWAAPGLLLGCSWAAPGLLLGCSWLLLAASGCLWLLLAAPGWSWLLLAASVCSWLLLAVVDANSRSNENYLFEVLHWDHTRNERVQENRARAP
jgi:hypothetical protein